MKSEFSFLYTVEPPFSNHPKYQDLVVAYGRWSLTRVEPEGVSSMQKQVWHIYLFEENLLHTFC